ncbi:MAG: hypothetical protein E7298_10060 [Lachnospiraceae bacterium]|nr:hypothetical protein [Lachnospiraceae bacterium]
MANKKRDVYKPKPMTEGKKAVIQGLLDEYDIKTADDIQEALKDLLNIPASVSLLSGHRKP